MAELEEMGYLEQPHTSAGRVPSELGYRFYVDSLLQHYAMTNKEIDQINALLKVKMGELDKILEVASKVASNITNYTGIAPEIHIVGDKSGHHPQKLLRIDILYNHEPTYSQ